MTEFLGKATGFLTFFPFFTSGNNSSIWQGWVGGSGGCWTRGAGFEGRPVFRIRLTSVHAFSTSEEIVCPRAPVRRLGGQGRVAGFFSIKVWLK
jgi:hypothetical protein